jgi:hypothetical protein
LCGATTAQATRILAHCSSCYCGYLATDISTSASLHRNSCPGVWHVVSVAWYAVLAASSLRRPYWYRQCTCTFSRSVSGVFDAALFTARRNLSRVAFWPPSGRRTPRPAAAGKRYAGKLVIFRAYCTHGPIFLLRKLCGSVVNKPEISFPFGPVHTVEFK